MSKKRPKKRKRILKFLIIFIFFISGLIYLGFKFIKQPSTFYGYIAGFKPTVLLYNKTLTQNIETIRGEKVLVTGKKINDEKNNIYQEIIKDKRTFYIEEKNLTNKEEKIVQEKKIYIRTPATIYKDIKSGKILGLGKKGSELEVLGYKELLEDGLVNIYQVKYNDEKGYIYGKYTVLNQEEATVFYEPDLYYDVHNKRGDRYGGGHAGNLDYYPVLKPIFKDNIMPNPVYALYLNNGRNIINKIDDYINLAKQTKINAFVVDIKDDEAPGYKSLVFEKYSPTNYQYANNSYSNYEEAIKKLKEAGFYVIGRITVFKDKYYVLDNPTKAIIDSKTKEPYLHSNTYWPSPFQRDVWEFNVNLAKEAVGMGFNEIQFDYVRFPDQTRDAEVKGLMNLGNIYEEEKAEAIQGFFFYATDVLHQLGVYVSADVFGESAYDYVTAYGQYWPAISNIVDVISGMPYPDHFNKYEFGFTEPVWTIPYDLLYHWGHNYVMIRQTEIPTPATIRTWIQGGDVPNYKHAGGYHYGEEEIEAQIKGLFDAGLNGGYMTWLSYSGLKRYQSQIKVYSKEY